MKIAFITLDAPFGQKETYIKTELRNIAKQADIFIFPLRRASKYKTKDTLLRYVADEKNPECKQGLGWYFISKLPRLMIVILRLLVFQRPKRFLYTLFIIPRSILLAKIVETRQITHIHAYWGTTPATCALIVSHLTKIKFSFSIHRADIQANDMLESKVRHSCFTRSVSSWGKKLAVNLGSSADKITVIHLGVDLPQMFQIKQRENNFHIVAIGDLVREKRTDVLISTVAEFPNLRLTIYGEGIKRRKLTSLINRYNLQKRVEIAGRVEQDIIFSFFKKRQFDLLVSPSSIEGITVAAMEAMAYAIPVACTLVGGNNELIDEKNAYILNPNLDNLNEIILKIPERSKIMSARKKIEREFDSKKNSLRLYQLIEKCK